MKNEQEERQQITYWLGHYQWHIEKAQAEIRLYQERLAKLDADESQRRYGLHNSDELLMTEEFGDWIKVNNGGEPYFSTTQLILNNYHYPDTGDVGDYHRPGYATLGVPIAIIQGMRKAYLESVKA